MDAKRPHMWILVSFPHDNMWTVTLVDSTSICEERNLDMISVILWKIQMIFLPMLNTGIIPSLINWQVCVNE